LIIYARETRNPSDSRRKRCGEENDADYAEEKGRVVTIETQPASGTTYGVSMSTTLVNGVRQVTVSLTGTLPSGARYVQLPVFTSAGVGSVTGGSYDTGSATVTFAANSTQVVVTLNS